MNWTKKKNAQACRRRDERVQKFLREQQEGKWLNMVAKPTSNTTTQVKKPAVIKRRVSWVKAKRGQGTILTEGEKKLCAEAFIATHATLNNISNTTQNSTNILTRITRNGLAVALQRLGLFIPTNGFDNILKDIPITSNQQSTTEDVEGYTFDGFIHVVQEFKKQAVRSRHRDSDLVEAFVGLGGDSKSLNEGGIPARNLHVFMKMLGISFDEKAAVGDDGDLIGFDYDRPDDDDDNQPSDHDDINVIATRSTVSYTQPENTSRRWKRLLNFVLGAIKFRRAVTPWFLNKPRINAFLSTSKTPDYVCHRREFKPATTWEGRKHGYYFTRGMMGMGYYLIKDEQTYPSFHNVELAKAESGGIPDDCNTEDENLHPLERLRKKVIRSKKLLASATSSSKLEPRKQVQDNQTRGLSSVDCASSRSVSVESQQSSEFGNYNLLPEICVTGPPADSPSSPQAIFIGPEPSVQQLSQPTFDSTPISLPASKTASRVFGRASLCYGEAPEEMQKPRRRTRCSLTEAVFGDFTVPAADDPNSDKSTTCLLGMDTFQSAGDNDGIFKTFESTRHDRPSLPSNNIENKRRLSSSFTGWTGAKWLWRGPKELEKKTTKAQEEGIEQEQRALRADKRVSEMLREVVFSLIASKQADDTSLWKGKTLPGGKYDDTEEHNWFVWREEAEAIEAQASDQGSRTYSQRLRELDDQFTLEEGEWEPSAHPDSGIRLTRYAEELGLRVTDKNDYDDVIDDFNIERISELSDLVTADRCIPFEDFASFFDRFRVYKGNEHVGVFKLPGRNRKTTRDPREVAAQWLVRSLGTLQEVIKKPSPMVELAIRRVSRAHSKQTINVEGVQMTKSDANGGFLTVGPTSCFGNKPNKKGITTTNSKHRPFQSGSPILITFSGKVVTPWSGVKYKNTSRREAGILVKGGCRSILMDWDKILKDIDSLDKGDTVINGDSIIQTAEESNDSNLPFDDNHSEELIEPDCSSEVTVKDQPQITTPLSPYTPVADFRFEKRREVVGDVSPPDQLLETVNICVTDTSQTLINSGCYIAPPAVVSHFTEIVARMSHFSTNPQWMASSRRSATPVPLTEKVVDEFYNPQSAQKGKARSHHKNAAPPVPKRRGVTLRKRLRNAVLRDLQETNNEILEEKKLLARKQRDRERNATAEREMVKLREAAIDRKINERAQRPSSSCSTSSGRLKLSYPKQAVEQLQFREMRNRINVSPEGTSPEGTICSLVTADSIDVDVVTVPSLSPSPPPRLLPSKLDNFHSHMRDTYLTKHFVRYHSTQSSQP